MMSDDFGTLTTVRIMQTSLPAMFVYKSTYPAVHVAWWTQQELNTGWEDKLNTGWEDKVQKRL